MFKKEEKPFIFLDEEDVKRLINFKDAFRVIEKSYALFSNDKTITPKTISMKIRNGMFFCFSSYLKSRKIFISKLATFYSENRKKGIPSIQPYISIFDSMNGCLIGIISARYFAGARTAITSAVGVKHLLGRSPKIMAIIGSGVQAEFHALIFANIFKSLKKIIVYSPNKKNLEKFIIKNRTILKNVKLIAANSSEIATKDADVIACVTDSVDPVIFDSAVKEGACILAVGSMGKDMQEVPDNIMSKAIVVVDSKQQIDEYGEIMAPRARGYNIKVIGEIGEFILRKVKNNFKGATIVFKHHGLPVTDAALAENIYFNFLK